VNLILFKLDAAACLSTNPSSGTRNSSM